MNAGVAGDQVFGAADRVERAMLDEDVEANVVEDREGSIEAGEGRLP